MGEDELERSVERQQLFLLLHDQVVGSLGVLSIAHIVLGGVRPATFFINGKIAVVDFLGGEIQVNLGEETLVGWQLGGAAVFLFKDARVVTFDRIAVRV